MQAITPLVWHIQQNHENLIVLLTGDLTRNTLLPLWKQRASFLSPSPNQNIYWNLQMLTKVDSAGFSLFIELLNHYQKCNANCIINAPHILRHLAELFDLDEWLGAFLYCETPK